MSQKVLAPIRDMVKEKKNVIVLPDGILNTVPFDLLTIEETEYRPLIENKVMSLMPSLKFMVSSKKGIQQQETRGLFALADPMYSKSPNISGLREDELRAVSRSSDYLNYFTPLPETRSEVESIAQQFKGEPVETLFGEKASESVFKGKDLRSYRYLHLATHGILGSEVPGIGEPALVLSEEKGEDGFLTVSEASNLKINTDLTVLSACNTGLGEYFTGEGVMGMSRSFLLAGSRSVLVSLWRVASLETVELMTSFYEYLRSGMSIPVALRQAKLDMMRGLSSIVSKEDTQRGLKIKQREQIKKQSRHPFYWAPFIIIGQ